MKDTHFKIQVAGENALIIYFAEGENFVFGDQTSAKISTSVLFAREELERNLSHVLIDTVPSYASLLVVFDVFKIDHYQLRQLIKGQLNTLTSDSVAVKKVLELPVYYDTTTGPDLIPIAQKL